MTDKTPVTVTRDGALAIVAIDSPPVNALGHSVRAGLMAAFTELAAAEGIAAIVLHGTTRAFSGGADITEFGRPRAAPGLKDVITLIEDSPVPVIAAIAGVALGGGLELALGCHYRLAWPDARVGLPEVKLGILPGAGGTQRLPRAIGVGPALRAIVLGDFLSGTEAHELGAVDALMDGPFPAAALDWARAHAASGDRRLPRLRAHDDKLIEARADPGLIDRLAAPLLRRAKGRAAPRACVEAVRAATMHPFDQGLAEEARLFETLVTGDESRAQRHVFFAERDAIKVPGVGPEHRAAPIRTTAVVGAGTMGGGIAMCFANAGIPVTLIDADPASLARGMDRVADNYRIAVSRGSLTESEMGRRLALFRPATDLAAVADADLVIEAVFEDMELKRKIFADLDRLARPGALLATNTSTLDIDDIASHTARPGDVLGMHFFSPANVMRLLEIVRGRSTAPEAIATAIAVGRAIGKQCAVVGNCDGFVGNRMLARRANQSERLLLEGALPPQVDAAITAFGLPMGPFAMSDLAGLDVSWRIRRHRGTTAAVADALCEAGRFGQKTGAGYYRYDGRAQTPDPEVTALIERLSAERQITRRAISDEEIVERLVYPMVNEAARILSEGIATRPGDIDVVWVHGYGFPVWRGGPMHWADDVGLPRIAARLSEFAAADRDDTLRPAPLLARLAGSDRKFASLAPGEAASLAHTEAAA